MISFTIRSSPKVGRPGSKLWKNTSRGSSRPFEICSQRAKALASSVLPVPPTPWITATRLRMARSRMKNSASRPKNTPSTAARSSAACSPRPWLRAKNLGRRLHRELRLALRRRSRQAQGREGVMDRHNPILKRHLALKARAQTVSLKPQRFAPFVHRLGYAFARKQSLVEHRHESGSRDHIDRIAHGDDRGRATKQKPCRHARFRACGVVRRFDLARLAGVQNDKRHAAFFERCSKIPCADKLSVGVLLKQHIALIARFEKVRVRGVGAPFHFRAEGAVSVEMNGVIGRAALFRRLETLLKRVKARRAQESRSERRFWFFPDAGTGVAPPPETAHP